MIEKTISVLITGRGNNTLKDKNVIKILGCPLLEYGAREGKLVKGASSFFVSSEDDKILSAAANVGYNKIIRPEEYARPTSQHADCLVHALKVMKKDHNIEPDILVVLLANSATVKKKWIDDCVSILINDENATSAVPVQRNNDHHPFRAKRIGGKGYLDTFIDLSMEKTSSNRQDLEANFFVCHNFWVLNLNNMKKDLSHGQPPWPFLGDKIIPYEVDYSLDVHHIEDVYLTEMWLKKNGYGDRKL